MQDQGQSERGNWENLIYVGLGQKEKQVGLYLTVLINQFVIFILQAIKNIYLKHTFIFVIGTEI